MKNPNRNVILHRKVAEDTNGCENRTIENDQKGIPMKVPRFLEFVPLVRSHIFLICVQEGFSNEEVQRYLTAVKII